LNTNIEIIFGKVLFNTVTNRIEKHLFHEISLDLPFLFLFFYRF
jgi:hypothetical protein